MALQLPPWALTGAVESTTAGWPETSALVGLGSGGADTFGVGVGGPVESWELRYARKVPPQARPIAVVRPALTRLAELTGVGRDAGWLAELLAQVSCWLVWLGEALPPGPPSHVRLAQIGPDSPRLRHCMSTLDHKYDGQEIARAVGLIAAVELAGSDPPLLVAPAEAGKTTVRSPAGLAWTEQQIHNGESALTVPTGRPDGLRVWPHHVQLITATHQPHQQIVVLAQGGLPGQGSVLDQGSQPQRGTA